MRTRKIALTGPAAAFWYGLDGYRTHEWKPTWCVPASAEGGSDIIRTRWWAEPVMLAEAPAPLAPLPIVLRHLGLFGDGPADGLTVAERVELALEHTLRLGAVELSELRCGGGSSVGDKILRSVLRARGDEPPTESYAETRAVQVLRGLGWPTWRQAHICGERRLLHRANLVVPTVPRSLRPARFQPCHGLLVEIDGREVHAELFERDHDRQCAYDALGFNWVSFTPRQIETDRHLVSRVLTTRMTAHRTTWLGRRPAKKL